MVSNQPAQTLRLRGLVKATARATVGRLPVVGAVSRKLWRRLRSWWHLPSRQEAVLNNLHDHSSIVSTQLDARFAQLGQQMQQTQDYLSSILGNVMDSIRDVGVRQTSFTNALIELRTNFLEQGLRDFRIRLQALADEHTQNVTTHLVRVADNLMAMEYEVVRLHDHHADSYNRLAEHTRNLVAEVNLLQGDVRGNSNWLQSLTESHGGTNRWVESISQGLHSNSAWIESNSAGLHGNSAWLKVLVRKMEMMAMDLRERVVVVPECGSYLVPQILDAQALKERIETDGGRIRVNLGCGEKPIPDYVNCDARPLNGVDVVADIRALPFEPGTLDEIASAHLVEHFRQHQLETVILPYWKSMLKPGGTLRIVCPNWGAMLRRLAENQMSLADFKQVTFGAQDYQGDDHFAMYTPDTLIEMLSRVGFHSPTVIDPERMNGLCPEMELTVLN